MSSSNFNCPYCWAEVPHQASVCSHCTRDLVLFKPLAVRLQELTVEVTQLQKAVASQAQALSGLQASPPSSETQAGTPVKTRHQSSRFLWTIATVSLCGIAISHWVMLFLYDAPPLYLRLLTILLPMLLGFIAARREGAGLPAHLGASVLLGLTSVASMLALTAYLDQVPWLPSNLRDWRETLEYSSSITLAFLTGFLLDRLLRRLTVRSNNQVNLKILLERDDAGQYKIAAISKQVESLVSAVAPIASAGTALYAGLKVFLGT